MIEIDQFGNRNELLSASEDLVMVTKVGDNYYWTNRNNVPMIRSESTIYVTYTALDGSGYVTVVNENARAVFLQQAPENIIGRFTYVEHIVSGLTSRTIYGR